MFSRRDAVTSAIVVLLAVVASGQVLQPGHRTKAAQAQNDTDQENPAAAKKSATPGQKRSGGEQLLKGQDCFSCHAVNHKVVGPAYVDVARKYAGKPNAMERLVRSVRDGEVGTWGTVPMTPHQAIPDAQLHAIVAWVLSLKNAPPAVGSGGTTSTTGAAKRKQYTYTLADGKTATLDFPIFVEGSKDKVTKEVFRGYELYNSYCFRCHGQDVTESELAPDLRTSMANGLTVEQCMAIAMAGRDDKGMPPWAGFLTEEEVNDILAYIEGRRFELIAVGRPPSEDQ